MAFLLSRAHEPRRSRLLARNLALAALAALAAVPAAAQEWPRTWQEENRFQAGPTPFEPLMAFWHELERLSPEVSIRPLTVTLLDRPLTLVVIARDGLVDPRDALRTGRAIVLVANSPHGPETAGKEASQLVARDLVAGDLRHLLDDVIVLIVPILNPDGGEVLRRTTERGFDLNRDYIKLESREIRALVTQVMNEWTPDIHVDTHHGGAAPYTLTWQGTLNPAADAELRAWPYRHLFPRIRDALRAEHYEGFDYSGPRTIDGEAVWGSTSIEPRKHHVYTGLVNSVGILLETPSGTHRLRDHGARLDTVPGHERYFHQVRGQVIALRTILQVAADQRDALRSATTGSRARASTAETVVLDYRLVSRGPDRVWVPDEDAPLGFRPQTREIMLDYEPARTTDRPIGYVLPPGMAPVVPLLLDHGIAVHRFTRPATLELEVYHATDVRHTGYFQGHYIKAVTVERDTGSVDVPAGAFYVSTRQSRGNLIAYLMEPETDDNLVTWGFANDFLRVTPPDLADADDEDLAPWQRRLRRQRVPIMRLVQPQPMNLVLVVPAIRHDRTRHYKPYD